MVMTVKRMMKMKTNEEAADGGADDGSVTGATIGFNANPCKSGAAPHRSVL